MPNLSFDTAEKRSVAAGEDFRRSQSDACPGGLVVPEVRLNYAIPEGWDKMWITRPQIGDDETVKQIDEFLGGGKGWVRVRGDINDLKMGLIVAGYRCADLKPLVPAADDGLAEDDGRPENVFDRTKFNSMTFEFELPSEADEFNDRFC